jgi:hypothetical protein
MLDILKSKIMGNMPINDKFRKAIGLLLLIEAPLPVYEVAKITDFSP